MEFSRNLVDWCFAGLIDHGASQGEARHDCSLAIHGDDLHVLACSGTPESDSAWSTSRITLHTVEAFRELAY